MNGGREGNTGEISNFTLEVILTRHSSINTHKIIIAEEENNLLASNTTLLRNTLNNLISISIIKISKTSNRKVIGVTL